jgi:hypothetical protein
MPFRRFLKKGLLFAAPFILWALAVVAVDPFDYFNVSHVCTEENKIKNAASLNWVVFNMLKEKHEPCENLIIGDSRAESLPLEQINQLTGQKFFKLSANALKLNESFDLYDFANKIKPVKRVVFTLNFNEFNEYAFADRVSSVEAMIHNPLIYLFDRSVAQAGYYVAKAALTEKKSVNSTPPMREDEFWDYIVNVRAREHYERFRYPEALFARMTNLTAQAKAQGTEVTFIIVPHHADFQKRVREFGLNETYLRFKRDLSRLDARVIDFDYVNPMTVGRDNFRDPLHYTDAFGKQIADEVFHGPLNHGKLLDAAWAEACGKFLF